MLRDFLARVRRRGRFAVALAAIAFVGVASLSACGVKGPLKPPPAAATASGARPAESPAAPAQESPATPAATSPLEPTPQPPATRP